MEQAAARLRAIKVLHTVVWALIGGAIVLLPWLAWRRHFEAAVVVIAVVAVEGLVLLAGRGQCPLTRVAARYTDDRRDNFDIYLPLWLARHNKTIFSALFAVGLCMTVARWRGW